MTSAPILWYLVGMAKRTTTTNVEDHLKAMRRAAREEERAAGTLGKRRKAGQMDGPTKAKASKNACRKRHNRGGWSE